MKDSSFLHSYHVQPNVWDEMFAANNLREAYKTFVGNIEGLSIDEMNRKNELAKKLFMTQGITFTVYSSGEGIEKIFPFDIIPRIIRAEEWKEIEEGIKQRLKAVNIFLKDIYHQQFIIKDGIVPAKLIYTCSGFLREMVNVDVPYDIYTHISGVDLIRDTDGKFFVLEDNLRTPSGVSYMLENRSITYRIFPDQLPRNNVLPVKDYPNLLLRNLMVAPPPIAHAPNPISLTNRSVFPNFL